MKRHNIGNLEQLKSVDFYTLSNNQKKMVMGGKETPGGSQPNGIPSEYTKNGRRYRSVPMRSWSSDKIDGDATCYTGEETCEIVTEI